jgi:hypothetical protein
MSIALLGTLTVVAAAPLHTAATTTVLRKTGSHEKIVEQEGTTAHEPGTQEAPNASATADSAPAVPQVSYEGGQLTIVAENSLLSDILSLLHARMGADIELPAGSSGERIWVRLGPGPARKVLAELLSNTDLNYIIQASETDVDGIRSVLLSARSKGMPAAPSSVTRVAATANRKVPFVNPNPPPLPEEENTASESQAASATPGSSPVTPEVPSVAASLQPSAAATGASDARNTSGLTSEQMIQQLQSMYEQRRQLQVQVRRTPLPAQPQ